MSRQYEDYALRAYKKQTDEMFAQSDKASKEVRKHLKELNDKLRQGGVEPHGDITDMEEL